MIASRKWDIVVLQDHSLGPVEAPARMLMYGEVLAGCVADVGASPVPYMTWARQHLPEMIEPLRSRYVELAERIGARVAPAGMAWSAALAKNPSLEFYTEDQSHPTALGSYLAALVLSAVLADLDPLGLSGNITVDGEPIIELEDALARSLQEVAGETVSKFGQPAPLSADAP